MGIVALFLSGTPRRFGFFHTVFLNPAFFLGFFVFLDFFGGALSPGAWIALFFSLGEERDPLS